MNENSRLAVIISDVGDVADLYATLASLSDQIFNNVQLYVCTSETTKQEIKFACLCFDLLPQVRFTDSSEGISSIEAEWILPLIPGDELTPDALARFSAAISLDNTAQLIYSDHAEFSVQEGEIVPFFKPGWSPEYLLATDYISRAVVKAECFKLKIQRVNFDQVDLWDLHLHISREADVKIGRIERILLSLIPLDAGALTSLAERANQILVRHLSLIGLTGSPRWADWAQRLALLSFDIDFPDCGPSVSILIPSKNNWRVLSRCVESLSKTTYENYEIIIIDNESDDPETVSYLQRSTHKVLRMASPPSGFSYSFVNNEAVKVATNEYILFLNDDTEVITPRWLSQMVGWLQLSSVASVGARLRFPNDRIQHAGIVHKMLDGILPGLPYRWLPSSLMAPRGQDRTIKNYSALTAACLLVRREEFVQIGMFDDEDFSVAYNDCDLGFRFVINGKRNVFEPNAELYHYEGFSRGSGRNNDKISEEIAFINKYRDWNDAYFNSNLSLDGNGIVTSNKRSAEIGLIDSRISIALFTHNLNYEGAPLVLLEIAEGLKKLCNADVTIFSPQDGALRARYEALGCHLEILSTWPIYSSRDPVEFELRIAEVIDKLALSGADVVIANTVLLHWPLAAAHRLKLPTIWIIHESEPPFEHLRPHGDMHVELAEEAMRDAAATIFVSKATKALYENYPKKHPAEVIYNGFDFQLAEKSLKTYEREDERQKLGVSPGETAILIPGTVCERKAQLDIVSAVQKLPQHVLNLSRFFIVGAVENEYCARLRKAVQALPLEMRERISLINSTPDIFRYFIAADIMVFPSHLESFPRVIQEAMYFGLGIITTPVFGIAEQVVEGKNALFFSPGDINKLASHIGTLVNNSELRLRMGSEAKLSLDRFPSIDEMQREYWELVKRVYHTEVPIQRSVVQNWVRDTRSDRSSWWEDLIRGG